MNCQNCNKRKATEDWVGDGGALAIVHGIVSKWCKVCCLETQLKHAIERATAIPALEKELAESLAKDSLNIETKCIKSEINKHCWHTGSGVDSASLGNFGNKSVTHYMCCWCAETKIEEYEWPVTDTPHGPHKWLSTWQWLTTPCIYPTYPYITKPFDTEICSIEEFFKQNPDSGSCLIACQCSRHRVNCSINS